MDSLFKVESKKRIIYDRESNSNICRHLDLDSIILQSSYCPFKLDYTHSVQIFGFPLRSTGLEFSNHLYHPMGSPSEKSIHKIKHFKLGKLSLLCEFSILVFFPNFPRPNNRESYWMTDAELDLFMDAFLNASNLILSMDKRQNTVQDSMIYRLSTGVRRASIGTYNIHGSDFQEICVVLRNLINDSDKYLNLKGYFFLFQAVGVKNSFKHEDPHDLEEILHSFQQVIKEESQDPLFNVYFDIGVNFQSTNNGYSLYWTKETTEELLSGSGLKHTAKDLYETTYSTSNMGGKAEWSRMQRKNHHNLAFIQIYHTDKNWLFLTKKIDSIIPKFKEIFLKKSQKYDDYLGFLKETFSSTRISTDGMCRVEYRVKGSIEAISCIQKFKNSRDFDNLKFYKVNTRAMKTYRGLLVKTFEAYFGYAIDSKLEILPFRREVLLYILRGLIIGVSKSVKTDRYIIHNVFQGDSQYSFKLWDSMTEYNFPYFANNSVDFQNIKQNSEDQNNFNDIPNIDGAPYSCWTLNKKAPRYLPNWQEMIKGQLLPDPQNEFLIRAVADHIFFMLQFDILSKLPSQNLVDNIHPEDFTLDQLDERVISYKFLPLGKIMCLYKTVDDLFFHFFPSAAFAKQSDHWARVMPYHDLFTHLENIFSLLNAREEMVTLSQRIIENLKRLLLESEFLPHCGKKTRSLWLLTSRNEIQLINPRLIIQQQEKKESQITNHFKKAKILPPPKNPLRLLNAEEDALKILNSFTKDIRCFLESNELMPRVSTGNDYEFDGTVSRKNLVALATRLNYVEITNTFLDHVEIYFPFQSHPHQDLLDFHYLQQFLHFRTLYTDQLMVHKLKKEILWKLRHDFFFLPYFSVDGIVTFKGNTLVVCAIDLKSRFTNSDMKALFPGINYVS